MVNKNKDSPGQVSPIPVDLVMIMDTSDSMKDEATELSALLETVIRAIEASCPSDLRVWWFGLEGVWPDTKFSQSYRKYLHQLGIDNAAIVGRPKGSLPDQGAQEEGAAAIIDISHHFNWRPEAARLILYLGDEALKGGNPHTQADVVAADRAIATARANSVTVFTYLGTKGGSLSETERRVIKAEYARVATTTGGQAYEAPLENLRQFQTALVEIVCAGGGYNDVTLPRVKPCFSLYWGNGPKDRIETDDQEVLCIRASNPYTNVIFKELKITVALLNFEGKEIPPLPDGTPSVYLSPSNVISFGDLPSCQNKCPGQIFREVTLVSRGAKAGSYSLAIEYSYSEMLIFQGVTQFTVELIAS